MNVYFDVLDTLLTEEEIPRAREAFLRSKEKGHDFYLWSSGGAGRSKISHHLEIAKRLVTEA